MVRPVFRALLGLAVCAAVCAACAAAPAEHQPWEGLWPELAASPDPTRAELDTDLFPARRPTSEQFAQLAAAERIYRQGDDVAFSEERDRIAEDPVMAFWLARMLVRAAIYAQDQAAVGTAAMIAEPAWQRPTRHLVGMGPAAAPCVVVDLMTRRQTDRRRYAIEVLGAMGPEVLPAWQQVFAVDNPRTRRAAVEVVAGWQQTPATLALLEECVHDEDFGVRAMAYRGLGRGGSESAARLRRALEQDADPFVQRAVVEAMAEFDDLATAEAVVGYLERSIVAGDAEAVAVADQTLRRLSGRKRGGTVASWRTWLDAVRREDRGQSEPVRRPAVGR